MKYAKLTKDGNIYKIYSYIDGGRKVLTTWDTKSTALFAGGPVLHTFRPKKYPSTYRIAIICDNDKEYDIGLFTIKNKDTNGDFSVVMENYTQYGEYHNVFVIHFMIDNNIILKKIIPASSTKNNVSVFFDRLE